MYSPGTPPPFSEMCSRSNCRAHAMPRVARGEMSTGDGSKRAKYRMRVSCKYAECMRCEKEGRRRDNRKIQVSCRAWVFHGMFLRRDTRGWHGNGRSSARREWGCPVKTSSAPDGEICAGQPNSAHTGGNFLRSQRSAYFATNSFVINFSSITESIWFPLNLFFCEANSIFPQ